MEVKAYAIHCIYNTDTVKNLKSISISISTYVHNHKTKIDPAS